MGLIVVHSGTPLSLGGLPEPQVRKYLFAAGPIRPIVDQLDAENCRVIALTPDPHGHLGPAREAVALIQQALSGTRQNPTMVESSPTAMSASRRFPSLVEESPALGAYPDAYVAMCSYAGSFLQIKVSPWRPGMLQEYADTPGQMSASL